METVKLSSSGIQKSAAVAKRMWVAVQHFQMRGLWMKLMMLQDV